MFNILQFLFLILLENCIEKLTNIKMAYVFPKNGRYQKLYLYKPRFFITAKRILKAFLGRLSIELIIVIITKFVYFL